MLRARYFAWHKIPSIIDDFLGWDVLIGESRTNLQTVSSSHMSTILRTRYFVSHTNPPISPIGLITLITLTKKQWLTAKKR
jgi:hypothetical protein